MAADQLWEGMRFPDWGEDSPRRLFALFERHSTTGLNAREREDYTTLLMVFVRMRFRQYKFLPSLRKLQAEPDDVGQRLVMDMLRKTEGRRLNHPCEKVLLHWLGFRLRHFVLTEIRRAETRRREVSATELVTGKTDATDRISGDPLDKGPGPARSVELSSVRTGLREAEGRICAGVSADPLVTRKLCRLMCRWATFGVPVKDGSRRSGLPTPEELPEPLRGLVTPELYNLVAPRVRRVVRDLAEVAAS